MDAASLQKVNGEDACESAPESASEIAGPLEEIHARIATAFTEPPEEQDTPPDTGLGSTPAAPPIGEISDRFAKAVEGQAEADSQSRQQDRDELNILKEAVRDLCDATVFFSSHTTQRFTDVLGRMSDSDGTLAALATDHAAHADRLEAADRNSKESESRLANLAIDHAAHADRLEAADRNIKESESRLASLATDHAAHADRLEAADRNIKESEFRLASLAAGQAAHANGLEAVHQRLRDSDALVQQFSKQLDAANNRFSVQDASILMLVDHNKGVNDRLNALQASIRRLEELISTLDKRLEVVAGLAGPVDVLREQNINLADQQRELRRALELVCEQAREARASEEQFARRMTATERKMSDSAERIEWISRWQSRIGQAFSAGPRD